MLEFYDALRVGEYEMGMIDEDRKTINEKIKERLKGLNSEKVEYAIDCSLSYEVLTFEFDVKGEKWKRKIGVVVGMMEEI